MTPSVGHEAAQPNPALAPFAVLVGTWRTEGTHPMVPGTTFHGRTVFEWAEGGAFLRMRSEIDEPQVPSGLAYYGTDDATGDCTVLYFDERGVSRHYHARVEGGTWTQWRDTREFAQRFEGTISDDGRTITGHGQMSRDGAPWEADLQLTYTRIE